MAIDRTKAAELFTEQYRLPVLQEMTKRSVALQTIPTFPMSSKTTRVPVLSALPTAGFLAASGDAKPETDVSWDKVVVTAEEIAAIVPIHDDVLADAQIDIADSVRDLLAQSIAKVVDAAVFFGTNAPTSWPTGGIAAATISDTEYVDNAEVFGAMFDAVEATHEVTQVWGGRSLRPLVRHPKDAAGDPIVELSRSEMYGVPVAYPLGWDNTASGAVAIAGQADHAILGIRQDITFSISDQATLTTYGNLWEKDSTAIRVVMRVGFALANPISVETGTRVHPFAAVVNAA